MVLLYFNLLALKRSFGKDHQVVKYIFYMHYGIIHDYNSILQYMDLQWLMSWLKYSQYPDLNILSVNIVIRIIESCQYLD